MTSKKELREQVESLTKTVKDSIQRDAARDEAEKTAAHQLKLKSIDAGLIPLAELKAMVDSACRDGDGSMTIRLELPSIYYDFRKREIQNAIVKAVTNV